MKILLYTIFCAGTLKLLSLFSPQQGPNGGTLKQAGDYYVEMKAESDTVLYAYLLNKDRGNISTKGISAEAKLFFSDSTTMNVNLRPATGNAFKAKITPGYYSCTVTFNVFGKPVSAQFEKQSQLVEKTN